MRAAQRVVDGGRRRLLDDLLVAALDGALALEEVHDGAVRVAEDLDLDVARPARRSARGTRCRRRTRRPPPGAAPATASSEVLGAAHEAHALARRRRREALTSSGQPTSSAAAAGVAVEPGDVAAGSTGTPAAAMRALAVELRAHRGDRLGRRADQVRPASSTARAKPAFSDRKP